VLGGLLRRVLKTRGSCGFLKLYSTSGFGLVGAVLTASGTDPLLNGGVNLHTVTLAGGEASLDTGTATGECLTVPVFSICDP